MHTAVTQNVTRSEATRLATEQALQRIKLVLDRGESRESRFAAVRLGFVVVVLAVVSGLWASLGSLERTVGVVVTLLLLLWVSLWHGRIKQAVRELRQMMLVLKAQKLRIKRDFQGLKEGVPQWHSDCLVHGVPAHHLYATDLDIPQQVFLWLDSCSTPEGSQRLLRELLASDSPSVTQPLAQDRARRTGEAAREISKHPSILRRWEMLRYNEAWRQALERPAHSGSQGMPSENQVTRTLPDHFLKPFSKAEKVMHFSFLAVSVSLWCLVYIPALFEFLRTGDQQKLLSAAMVAILFPLVGIAVHLNVTQSAQALARRVQVLSVVMGSLNRYSGSLNCVKHLSIRKDAAEGILRRLARSLAWLELRGNPIAWFALHILLPFDSLLCFFLLLDSDRVRAHFHSWWEDVTTWDYWCALARIKSENPDFIFTNALASPSLSSASESHPSHSLTGEPPPKQDTLSLTAVALGHPLLPYAKRVCNDLCLDSKKRMLLLTGSNMAGKSTFLRAMGLNIVLANMGAPVCASSFSAPAMLVGAAIRVQDSLEESTSYFYAEVKRLKILLKISEENNSTLVLVDEIFKGTNNKERLLGSQKVIEALLQTHAWGAISTHDLALSELEKTQTAIANVHFRETIAGQQLAFDYKLRQGPCPTTNALFIMKAAGLPIPDQWLSLPTPTAVAPEG